MCKNATVEQWHYSLFMLSKQKALMWHKWNFNFLDHVKSTIIMLNIAKSVWISEIMFYTFWLKFLAQIVLNIM